MNRRLLCILFSAILLLPSCAAGNKASDKDQSIAIDLQHDDYPKNNERIPFGETVDSMGFAGPQIEDPCFLKVESLVPTNVYLRSSDGKPIAFLPSMKTKTIFADPDEVVTVEVGASREPGGAFFTTNAWQCTAHETASWLVE